MCPEKRKLHNFALPEFITLYNTVFIIFFIIGINNFLGHKIELGLVSEFGILPVRMGRKFIQTMRM